MKAFEKIGPRGYEMLEAYAAFRRLLDEYAGEGDSNGEYEGPNEVEGFDESDPFMAMAAEQDSYSNDTKGASLPDDEDQDEVADGDYDFVPGDGYDAFPGRKTFRMEDIDEDDPEFYRGKEIGIPLNLAVRISPSQGKQLPIAGLSGLFGRPRRR